MAAISKAADTNEFEKKKKRQTVSKQFLKIRAKVSRARLPQRVVCFSVWEEKVEKCCFACSYRRVRAE